MVESLPKISKSGQDPYLAALYPQGAPASLQTILIAKGEALVDLPAARRQHTHIHAVFETGSGLARVRQLARIGRQLSQHCFSCQLVGLSGFIEHPGMVVPLHRNILHYVHTVAFRATDSPARVFLKRLASFLPGKWTWIGPLILVGSPTPQAFDRFVLLTGNREIAFLFHAGDTKPWAVCKSGDIAELESERHNHEHAQRILGQHVPALLEMTRTGQMASITLEYVCERFLGNVVAASLFGKRQVFIREALKHLDFCCEIYRLLAANDHVEHAPVTQAEVNGLLAGIDELVRDSANGGLLAKALGKTIGMLIPRLTQHGDFCARNVLIADGERGRVLIDWEDMGERRWPLTDFVLLRLSLKEVYARLFNRSQEEMTNLPEIAQGLTEVTAGLARMLSMNQQHFIAAQFLSLACLCRQNLRKGRKKTASAVFMELMTILKNHLPPADSGTLA